jgi:hypothetical protein
LHFCFFRLPAVTDLETARLETELLKIFDCRLSHSTPRTGHPLFVGFIRAARERKAGGALANDAGMNEAAA